MISFANDSMLDGGDRREHAEEPRTVGQFMAAVLARYGIAQNADSMRPRLPLLEHQATQFRELLSVG